LGARGREAEPPVVGTQGDSVDDLSRFTREVPETESCPKAPVSSSSAQPSLVDPTRAPPGPGDALGRTRTCSPRSRGGLGAASRESFRGLDRRAYRRSSLPASRKCHPVPRPPSVSPPGFGIHGRENWSAATLRRRGFQPRWESSTSLFLPHVSVLSLSNYARGAASTFARATAQPPVAGRATAMLRLTNAAQIRSTRRVRKRYSATLFGCCAHVLRRDIDGASGLAAPAFAGPTLCQCGPPFRTEGLRFGHSTGLGSFALASAPPC